MIIIIFRKISSNRTWLTYLYLFIHELINITYKQLHVLTKFFYITHSIYNKALKNFCGRISLFLFVTWNSLTMKQQLDFWESHIPPQMLF